MIYIISSRMKFCPKCESILHQNLVHRNKRPPRISAHDPIHGGQISARALNRGFTVTIYVESLAQDFFFKLQYLIENFHFRSASGYPPFWGHPLLEYPPL